MRLMILLGMFLTASGLSSALAASSWQSVGFDGSGFQQGAVAGAILVRDGYLPVAKGAGQLLEDPLPGGTGAVALYCYLQSSGGKLRRHAGFLPIVGCAVTVGGQALTLAARSDENGYLILALPPGSYDLHLFGITRKVTVELGKTALVAIRGGKRMVD